MGIYLNPGNSAFKEILNTEYVDKTGLIGLINQSIGTVKKLTCISRPRRFGKSFAAKMLCAYYDRSCDSHDLFRGLDIEKELSYEEHINKYDVILVDMTSIKSVSDNYTSIEGYLSKKLYEELKISYPDIEEGDTLSDTLLHAVSLTHNKIIMIVDEWDAPIRENPDAERTYLEFLRSLFKNTGTTDKIFAAVYMTGILPIRRDGSQSAISDFKEFTIIKPRVYGRYVGFTEAEVMDLCEKHDICFATMKYWYDGYNFKDVGSVYNPNSVMQAIENKDFDSYWTETSAATGLMEYISKGYTGLTKTIAELIGGLNVKVDTLGFVNDMKTFRGKDDVLTLLIHLGYLSYDSEKGTAQIPNEEVRREFSKAVRVVDHEETLKRLNESDKLFLDTIQGHADAVAAQIEKIHEEETTPIHYNKEDSLRSVIKLAYYTYKDNYMQLEELPAGIGYADIVYLPKKTSDYPALVIELKWNKTADGAIEQIKTRRYPKALDGFDGDIILVGINYDKDTKKHSCMIERYVKG